MKTVKTEFIAFRATEKHRQTITKFAQANQMSMSAAIISLIEDLANSRQQKTVTQSFDAARNGSSK